MFLIRLFYISILLISTLIVVPEDRIIFIPPLKIPVLLSANFGELRIDHFHSGLDIKTQGVTGKEVVAAANGYIYRISVTPGGFGNALYLRHPSGYSTVYGHLDRFAPDIEKYVKSQQYERKSFQVTFFPPKEKFPVNQGDLIAYSGNSGGSGGPHLHFEVRKSDSEIPVNPLLFNIGIRDDIRPVIEKLFIYPVNKNSLVSGQHSIKKVTVSGSNGSYYLPEGTDITISGPAGFGIKSYDLLNESHNKCEVYSISLKVDSTVIFRYIMDEFSFNESRYINSHIDYETYMRENSFIERTFILPNDKLSVYKDVINRGIYNFSDNKIHRIEIEVNDIFHNKSTLRFDVKSELSVNPPAAPVKKEGVMMPFNRTNRFRTGDIAVTIPAGALYDTLNFMYKKDIGNSMMYSDVHYIHNKYTPVQKAFSISIKPSVIPSGKESKLIVVQLSDDFKKSALSSSYSDGFVTADALSFGMFFVGIDTVAPDIYPVSFQSGGDLSGKSELKIRITDDLSGIQSYDPLIDGNWALFEYDQKNDLLIYRFDPERITKGTMHKLVLKVTDNKNNQSEFDCDFKW